MREPHLPGLTRLFLINPRRSPEAIEKQVDRLLRRLVTRTYEYVPLYRETWKQAGFHPRDFSGRQDLKHIPMVDKNLIVDAGNDALDRRVDPDSLQVISTSGTSGCTIHVRRTFWEQRVTRLSYLRAVCVAGGRPWHPTVTVCSSWLKGKQGPIMPWISRTRHILPLDSLDKQIETLKSYRALGVIGQTGTTYLLAREMLRRGVRHPVRFIALNGSMLLPEMAEAMREAFGVYPHDLYGAMEIGPVSWQCRNRNYHLDVDRVVTEIVDEQGNPLPVGEPGQVVVTSLYSYTMPFIRYKLLDIASLSTRTCDCGCRFPLMEVVQGRINDFLPTPKGDLVSPHYFFHLFDAAGSDPVKEWRIIQEDLDDIVFEYIPEDDFDPAALQKGMDVIRARFGENSRIRPVRVESIPGCPNTGKRTVIVSRLRPENFVYGKPWIPDKTDEVHRVPVSAGHKKTAEPQAADHA